MQINARWIEKMIKVELPYDSSEMLYLEKFLRSGGFIFNPKIERFECECIEEEDEFTVTWRKAHTPKMTVLNTFLGRIIPMEDSIKQIVYPLHPEINYILEMSGKELDTVIKIIFKNHFEIIGISQGGQSQLYEMKKNRILLYRPNSYSDTDNIRMTFTGFDNISRPILNSFCIS
jgi:hypothetical protein